MPEYAEWLQVFREWAATFKNPTQAIYEIRRRMWQNSNHSVGESVLRNHLNGDYDDVGLTLARAVWRETKGARR